MEIDLNKVRRYELKYTINESLAAAIRDYIQSIFSLDKHADPQKRGYIVNNMYMDTPGLRFYYDTKFRKLTRFKSRIRYYGSKPDDFAMLELKHRHNTIIWKKRRKIPIESWPAVLDVVPSDRRVWKISGPPETFEQVHQVFGTIPILHVRYFREPYVSDIDPYGRVTFDRSLRCRLAHGSYDLAAPDEQMVYYDDPITTRCADSPVVLEIKTETFVPFWAVDIIRRFELMQRGYSKYCYVIDKFRENDFSPRELAI